MPSSWLPCSVPSSSLFLHASTINSAMVPGNPCFFLSFIILYRIPCDTGYYSIRFSLRMGPSVTSCILVSGYPMACCWPIWSSFCSGLDSYVSCSLCWFCGTGESNPGPFMCETIYHRATFTATGPRPKYYFFWCLTWWQIAAFPSSSYCSWQDSKCLTMRVPPM